MPDPILPPKINVGPDGPAAWKQAGYKYGVNDSGPFQRFTYRGPRAEVAALAPQFNLEGWTWEVTHEAAGLATLEAASGFYGGTNPTNEEPENIWELDAAETEKALTEADFPFSSLLAISKANKDRIQDALRKPEDFINTSPAFSGADAASANTLYLLMKEGVQSFPVESTVLRHTQIVSNRYTVQASYLNCNRIISTASMSSLEGVPGDLLFVLPPEPTPTQFIETPGDLQYGWRKQRPSVTRLSKFKWRISQAWQFNLWALKIYGPRL